MRERKKRVVSILSGPCSESCKTKSTKTDKSKGGGSVGSKYKARSSKEADGFFSSQKELKRYRELQLLEKAGVIKDLKRQVRHKLVVNGVLIATYVSDSEYITVATGKHTVEDTKSPMTKKLAPYRMKRQLMKALFNIVILET